MIQSPRGSINFPARTSFDSQVNYKSSTQNIDLSDPTLIHTKTTNPDNQLVWTNPTRSTLNPQITRQLAYSETLLIR